MKAKQVQKKKKFVRMILIVTTGLLLEGCGGFIGVVLIASQARELDVSQ